MASSLGSIFVELTCNTAKFLTGMDKAGLAAKKTGRDIRSGLGVTGNALAALGDIGARIGSILQGVGSKIGDAFDVAGRRGRGLGMLLSGSILGGATAAAGGLFALAVKAADVGAQIYDASIKTGISAGQMSGLMAITKQTNGNFDALSTSLARAGANLEKTSESGGKTNKVLFEMMGGARSASELGLRPMGDRIQAVLAHIFALHDVGQRNLALNQLLGRGWMENVTSLRLLADQGYVPAIAKAREFGIYFDDARAAQAKQFTAAMSIMKGEMAALGMVIGEKVIPVIMDMIQGLQGLSAFAGRLFSLKSAVLALIPGFGPLIAIWKATKDAAKDSTQAQTDFLTHLQSLTAGEKAASETEKGLTGATKARSDVLAQLIDREQDELSTLDIHNTREREAAREYDRTIGEIKKAVAAHGSLAEAYKAGALALDIYYQKLGKLWPVLAKPPVAPALKMVLPATMPGGSMPATPLPTGFIDQLIKARNAEESLGKTAHYLREEENLSTPALLRLQAAFHGLVMYQIAASEPGEKYIRTLEHMEQLGAFVSAKDKFSEFKDQLIVDGNDMAGHLIKDLGGALDQIEGQIARLAVTGKRVNFKQIMQGLGEGVIKSGEQKAVSMVLGGIGIHTGGTRPDGSQGHPMWVRMADKAGLGGLLGGAKGESGGAGAGIGGLISGALSGISKSISGVLGKFAGRFGGFLASGGDVTPGKAYVVGERHPEFFVPRASGAVVPSLAAQQLRPLHYSPTYNINTPDADSFRRSQTQIAAEGYRHVAMLHARNN